jgi:hypothetical protein
MASLPIACLFSLTGERASTHTRGLTVKMDLRGDILFPWSLLAQRSHMIILNFVQIRGTLDSFRITSRL